MQAACGLVIGLTKINFKSGVQTSIQMMDLLQTSLTIMQYSKMATVNCIFGSYEDEIILIQIKSKKQISRPVCISVIFKVFKLVNQMMRIRR
jgi:hypothetical protein